VNVFKLLGYEPTLRQKQFHASKAHAVLLGGALGGGKSKALTMEALRAAVLYPGIRIGAFRRTFDELSESLLAELAKVDFAEALGATWNKSTHTLTFLNSSVIRFRYAETVEDASRRQGGEYQLVIFDEAGLVPGEVIEALEERQRTSDPKIPVLGLRLASNPGDVGHMWLKNRFIDPTNYGKHPAVDEQGRSIEFVPSKASDNPHLDKNYYKQLDAISDPERRRALRDGDWDVLAGAMFGEWNRERHVVEPFEIPKDWARKAGVDYGFAAPWAVVWLAVDPDQRVWLYRSLYATKVPEREQAKMILAAEQAAGEVGVYRVMDPAAWGQTGSALPPAVQYLLEGCAVEKALNDRLSGASRFHTYLAEGPACAHHRALGWSTCPMMHVFSTMTDWIKTVPTLPRDPKRPEDVLTTAIDHLYDASRYCLMSIGTAGGPVLYAEYDGPNRRLSTVEMGGPEPLPVIGGFAWGNRNAGLAELGVSFEREDGSTPGATQTSPFTGP
jgi:hypothetical protein